MIGLLIAVLLLTGLGLFVWIVSATDGTDLEAQTDVRLHEIRRSLDGSILRGEIRRDAQRLRRELDQELGEE